MKYTLVILYMSNIFSIFSLLKLPPISSLYSVERSFEVNKNNSNDQWHLLNVYYVLLHIVDLKQVDCQLFHQEKKSGGLLFRISKELQFRACNHGKPQASLQQKWRRALFYRRGKEIGRAIVNKESMDFHWLSCDSVSLVELLPGKKRSLSSSY